MSSYVYIATTIAKEDGSCERRGLYPIILRFVGQVEMSLRAVQQRKVLLDVVERVTGYGGMIMAGRREVIGGCVGDLPASPAGHPVRGCLYRGMLTPYP